jgi:hypothetical protein
LSGSTSRAASANPHMRICGLVDGSDPRRYQAFMQPHRTYVESRGPLSALVALYGCMGNFFSHRLRLPLPGRLSLLAADRGDHFLGSLLCFEVQTESKLPLRLSLRGWLRPSLRLWFRGPIDPKGSQSPSQRRLRDWRFADIPTSAPSESGTKKSPARLARCWLVASCFACRAKEQPPEQTHRARQSVFSTNLEAECLCPLVDVVEPIGFAGVKASGTFFKAGNDFFGFPFLARGKTELSEFLDRDP